MRLEATRYRDENTGATYLALYHQNYGDLYFTLPRDVPGFQLVAHASYKKGNASVGIDVFLFPNGIPREAGKYLKHRKEFSIRDKQVQRGIQTLPAVSLDGNMAKYGIRAELVDQGEERNANLIYLLNTDIAEHCRGRDTNKPREPLISKVGKIIPVTSLRRLPKEKRILDGGKSWFDPLCLFEANIDFVNSCIVSFVPGEKSEFDGKTFKGYYDFPWGDCPYCYASPAHISFPKTFRDISMERLEEELNGKAKLKFNSDTHLNRKVRILRFGKRTEACSPFTMHEFKQSLEVCARTGTTPVVITRFLDFDREVVDLFQRTSGSLIYSIAFDDFDMGCALYWGNTNDWRIQNAIRYREAGVKAGIDMLVNPIATKKEPDEREQEILDRTRYGRSVPIQILPVNFPGKEIAEAMTGLSWDTLKRMPSPNQLELRSERGPFLSTPETAGGYTNNGGKIKATILPAYWTELIKRSNGRIKICHHYEDPESMTCHAWCGSCLVGSKQREKITEIMRRKPHSNPRNKRYGDKKQKELKFPKENTTKPKNNKL